MARDHSATRGDGHLIEVAEGAEATLRPDVIPPDGLPRHHVVNIRPSAQVDLFIDDLTHLPSMSRSLEIWVGAGARLRIIDRACTRNSTVDLVGLRVAEGAVVEFVGLRAGVSQSAVLATDLGPNARVSLTWLHQASRAESVDVRVRGTGSEARHTLMLSAPSATAPAPSDSMSPPTRRANPSASCCSRGNPPTTCSSWGSSDAPHRGRQPRRRRDAPAAPRDAAAQPLTDSWCHPETDRQPHRRPTQFQVPRTSAREISRSSCCTQVEMCPRLPFGYPSG